MSKSKAMTEGATSVTLPATWKPESLEKLPRTALRPADVPVVRAQLTAEARVFCLASAEGVTQAAVQARQAVSHAVARARAAREVLAGAAQAAAKFPVSGITSLELCVTGMAILVTQAAEFVFAWTTLPMVIGVRRHSVEGVAIAALAVAALFSLKFAFARLGILGFQASGSRLLHGVAMAFAFAIGAVTLALNLELINQIALLREVAVAVGLGGESLPLDSKGIGEALRTIALVAAIDGALLVTVFEGERQRRLAVARVATVRESCLEADRAVGAAIAEKKAAAALLNNREQWATELTAAFVARGDVLIHEALVRGEPKSLEERVARLLGQPA